MVPFTRLLGPRSGIQLNPVIDNTERFVQGTESQTFAVAGRFDRGRIDKPFRVNRGNLYRLLGQPTSATVNRLNETLIQIYEAFQAGAYEAIVYRLNVTDAALNSLFITGAEVDASVWSTAETAPVGTLITIKHLEAFNEGIRAEINAAENIVDSAQAPSKTVTIRLKDVTTGETLYEFTGSLDPLAKDEFGESTFLTNVVAKSTDVVEVTVAASAAVPVDAAFYGADVDGVAKFIGEDLVYFTEGGTVYDNEDYDRACTALKYGDFSFGYIIGGGTRATALISKLAALGKDINKQFIWDIAGDKTPAQAIEFYNGLSLDTHYSQAYWTPLYADDPINGGKDYIGVSGVQVGLRCARNALTDANGIPPKNRVIAGKDFSLPRTGVIQKQTPTEIQLDDLARARINPTVYTRYNSGGRYVFVDSLTGAKTEADRKLIAVAEMSSQIDDWVAAFGQECLQLPMLEGIKRMTDFLQLLFEGVEAAKWIKPSKELGNRSFIAEVKPNAARPSDRMDVSYFLKFDGTVRAIYIQQTISK